VRSAQRTRSTAITSAESTATIAAAHAGEAYGIKTVTLLDKGNGRTYPITGPIAMAGPAGMCHKLTNQTAVDFAKCCTTMRVGYL
jgi:hypothetical protein